ncbi:putative callose synthase 8 [Phtheirospermum japonicum]|uniref:1,3-beta-glucan synthase n=1 Tax=Phtheirospermum japonicum TaxID=374723 RepID=A0A830DAW9_9LAMI|nr:putative callose synthase 8 [Phtheirospermum japonicum]
MSEIVVSDELNRASTSTSNRRVYTTANTRHYTRSLTSGRENVPEPFDSEKLPITLVSEIQRFLRVANQIEIDEPRVAYLCRFHAFEVAHNLDRNSSGRGVRQFKTSLLQRLEQDEEVTIRKRREKSDLRELRRVYCIYKDYIIKHGGEYTLENREKLIKARAIASVLFEVLSTVTSAAGSQALAESDHSRSEFYVPYNILPLDQGGVHQAIMQLPEIKYAIAVVRNVRGLPFLDDFKRRQPYIDLFDWLQFCFGFQKGNVANQREHLILLFANSHVRQTHKQAPKSEDGAADELMKKFFKNYTEWCKFLDRKSNIRMHFGKERKNLKGVTVILKDNWMASELHGMLTGAVSLTTGEIVMPAYGGATEAFLTHVVCPIYEVIREEAMKNRNGTTDHSTWRNYDDLNEFFWSPECFEIGWPMRRDHDFFCVDPSKDGKKKKSKRSVETNEEEKSDNVEDVEMGPDFSFCPTGSGHVRSARPAVLDFAFKWKARSTMDSTHRRKDLLKIAEAIVWTIVLPIFYSSTRRKYTCYSAQDGSWIREWCYSSYMIAVAFYLIRNAVNMVLFFVPAVGKYIETSNYRICTALSWWSQIKPLIAPTRQIMSIGVKNYDWHELFPKVKSNAGAIAAIWAPIILIYFMDAQIWYSVYCSVFGGVYGILHHLGEIRTQGMLRSKFATLPAAFNDCLIPPRPKDSKGITMWLCNPGFLKELENKKGGVLKFAIMWNQIISSFRDEDLISDSEMDLMKMPVSSELISNRVRWPVFLLANKLSVALSIARDFVGKHENLLKRIRKDSYMYMVVTECYESLKYILDILVVGDMERRIISGIIDEIEESIENSSLLTDLHMSELPALHAKCTDLITLLVEGNEDCHYRVVKTLQDIFELVTNDLFVNGSRTLDLLHDLRQQDGETTVFLGHVEPELFASNHSVHFPLPDRGTLMEKIKRFHLLLTVKDKALYIPSNLEARRRISYFATSLFMNMPKAPKVRDMLSFSVLTPHFMEEVKFSNEELHSSKDGVSISFYMQKIFPDEWENFLERLGRESVDGDDNIDEKYLRDWASFRGQTLSRTVRGMMYYRKALKLQAFLDMAEDDDILQNYDAIDRTNDTLSAQLDALVDMKFTHVVSCQIYGSQKSTGDPQARDILELMIKYPSLRVAYVEEKEEIVPDRSPNVYSSILLKAVNGFDQEIYRIKLPGPPNIGEGKPENQNHAIIFTRGEALQAIDMNQDNYLEEALKMRNLLQEFLRVQRRSPPTILGMREHIFTGSVSSLAWFMSYQETSFVTIGQRLLANPLRVRFHYGHPDVFDRIFHLTRGGISKASKTINLSEDVFAGFNTTLRRGYVTYHEYMQVGKGRDVGLNQISKFEAKISIIGVYVFLYGQLYLVLSGLHRALLLEAKVKNIKSLETALASQSFIQLGLLTGLPMVIELGLERGFLNALKDFVLMQLQLAAVFFTFSYGTKAHYYGRTILHGGAKYRPTGRKVVVFHSSFTESYRLYSRSHFVKGFELLILLIVYDLFRRSYQSSMAYVLITYAIWFMSMTWLFAPFLFNPSGFDWGKIVDDWKDWNKWIKQQGGIGIPQDKSWQSWWVEEQAHLLHCGITSRLIELLLSLRFFLYQYGLVYHLDISGQNKNFVVYVLSWTVIVAIFLLLKIVNVGRQYLSANHHLAFRLFKAFLFLGVLATIITLSLICHLSVKDLIVCCLAFLPTGWGLILVAQTLRPKIEGTGLWHFTWVFARAYDYGMGVVLFAPIAALAWLPIISAFQTRFLFNEAFSRKLQIQQIIAGKKKHKT